MNNKKSVPGAATPYGTQKSKQLQDKPIRQACQMGGEIMIAEIRLDSVIKKAVYEKLKDVLDLQPTDKRVGVGRYSSEAIEMPDGTYYLDELLEKEDGYYDKNDLEKKVESYAQFNRPLEQYIHIQNRNHLVDIQAISRQFPSLTYQVLRAVPIEENSVSSLAATIRQLEEKIHTLSNMNFDFNAKCNVHVAGFGLLSVKDVTYRTDLCTDELQEMLDEGWRILACCVQPDQRRPDYIFGRMELPE